MLASLDIECTWFTLTHISHNGVVICILVSIEVDVCVKSSNQVKVS